MSKPSTRHSKLVQLYQQYLTDEDTAGFIIAVADRYNLASLERLARQGDRMSRRAAVLALGFLGDFSNNETLGRALSDRDRAVRMLADMNIRRVWFRQGSPAVRAALTQLEQLNCADQADEVVAWATDLLRYDKQLAEAWNQRAIAFSALGDYHRAIADCRETLNCNRYHFPAAIGLGQCCLELDDPRAALDCFRLALTINPDLESLRVQIQHLEKLMNPGK